MTTTAQDIQPGQTVRFPRSGSVRCYQRPYRITVAIEQVNPWEFVSDRTVWVRGRQITHNAKGTTVHSIRSYTIDSDCPVEIVEETP